MNKLIKLVWTVDYQRQEQISPRLPFCLVDFREVGVRFFHSLSIHYLLKFVFILYMPGRLVILHQNNSVYSLNFSLYFLFSYFPLSGGCLKSKFLFFFIGGSLSSWRFYCVFLSVPLYTNIILQEKTFFIGLFIFQFCRVTIMWWFQTFNHAYSKIID